MDFMQHEKYMKRCIDLAKIGSGNTSPNPLVGAVIVYNDQIIGEGYHKKHGEAHAEVNAINSVKDKELLKKSTIYVNLEPCAHYGKTPPCANLIANSGIPNIVIGTIDPAAHVSGKGVEILRSAGCNVQIGILEEESRDLNKRFFTFHVKKRPYIILKWAESIDGFIDVNIDDKKEIHPTWITNQFSKSLVHKWRAEEDAIFVGTNTVLFDNPILTTRNWSGKNPLRIVLDRSLKLSHSHRIFNGDANTLIIADNKFREQTISNLGGNISIEYIDFSDDFMAQLLLVFLKYGILSLIVEGGRKVLQNFIDQNYWDEARVFIGPKTLDNGISAPTIDKRDSFIENLGKSKLFFITNNSVFHQ